MDTAAIAERVSEILTQTGLAVAFSVENEGEADVDCTGARTVLKRADVNLDAGLAGHYSFSLLCPAEQLAAATLEPRRTKVLIGLARYRLLATDADALGTSYRLHLGGTLQ